MVSPLTIPPSQGPANKTPQADKLRTQQELERLQAKYVGTGHPDTTSWEWRTNIHRDTLSSIVGHPALLNYIATAENEAIPLVRARMIRVSCLPALSVLALSLTWGQKMLQPVGPPPPREEDIPVPPEMLQKKK